MIVPDAFSTAFGACISEEDENGDLRPIAFAGKALIDAKTSYSSTDRELLGIRYDSKEFRHYIRQCLILSL